MGWDNWRKDPGVKRPDSAQVRPGTFMNLRWSEIRKTKTEVHATRPPFFRAAVGSSSLWSSNSFWAAGCRLARSWCSHISSTDQESFEKHSRSSTGGCWCRILCTEQQQAKKLTHMMKGDYIPVDAYTRKREFVCARLGARSLSIAFLTLWNSSWTTSSSRFLPQSNNKQRSSPLISMLTESGK